MTSAKHELVRLWIEEQTKDYRTSEPQYKLGLDCDAIAEFKHTYIRPTITPTAVQQRAMDIDHEFGVSFGSSEEKDISSYEERVEDAYTTLDSQVHEIIIDMMTEGLISGI